MGASIPQNVADMGDVDLLAAVLGSVRGSQVLAAEFLERHGSLEAVCRLGSPALRGRGIGPAAARRLAASLEIGRRTLARCAEPRPVVRCSADVAAHFTPKLAPLRHEEMWLLALDGRNGILAERRVARGDRSTCAAAPSEILRAAISEAASAMVLVHNHPSGDPAPSGDDIAMTRRMIEAGQAVGVPLVDHVIVAARAHTSLADLGLFRPSTE